MNSAQSPCGRSAFFLCAGAVLTIASLPALAIDPPLGVNLVANPGAEQGATSTNGLYSVEIPGWTVSSGLTVASYANTAGIPNLLSPGSPNRALNYFIGGPTHSTATAVQFIALDPLIELIDADRAEFEIGAWLGGTASQDDSAVLIAIFNDANGDSLATVNLTGPTAAARGNQTGMLRRSRAGVIPVGSRSANVMLLMSRAVGPFNDGCADDVTLVVSEGLCAADWNADTAVDSDDILVFFADWEAGDGDFDNDDDSDSDDVFAFFGRWDSGC